MEKPVVVHQMGHKEMSGVGPLTPKSVLNFYPLQLKFLGILWSQPTIETQLE